MSGSKYYYWSDEEVRVRNLILQNIGLLKQVCDAVDSAKVCTLLASADASELELLGYLCHLTLSGQIPMTRANYKLLVQKKKRGRLETEFRQARRYEAFKLLDRKDKFNIIKHVGIGVSFCLKGIFYESNSALSK